LRGSQYLALALAKLTSETIECMDLKLYFYRPALEVEKELLKNLAEKEPTFAEISYNISESVLFCVLSQLFQYCCAQLV
jgi:hypothetical protein